MSGSLQVFVRAAVAPEMPLPQSDALTFTRNFAWVVAVCAASVLTVPLVVALAAMLLLD